MKLDIESLLDYRPAGGGATTKDPPPCAPEMEEHLRSRLDTVAATLLVVIVGCR